MPKDPDEEIEVGKFRPLHVEVGEVDGDDEGLDMSEAARPLIIVNTENIEKTIRIDLAVSFSSFLYQLFNPETFNIFPTMKATATSTMEKSTPTMATGIASLTQVLNDTFVPVNMQ
ncbi:hypothetical protein M1614_01845 [Candidatus Marsarchaeota archaeon]|nr:hypothetical protein [Candidatus Marsarchaeota archaeon]